MQTEHSEVDGFCATARELMWLYNEGRLAMADIDRVMVNKMNAALKNARVQVANGGKKIKPTGGISSTYFCVGQQPEFVPSWSTAVKDRLFWTRLKDSEQGQVASGRSEVASSDKY
jgi:hypothetical protein